MHVTSVNVDSTGACGRKHLITVCVKLSGAKEMMTINVFVPHKRDDQPHVLMNEVRSGPRASTVRRLTPSERMHISGSSFVRSTERFFTCHYQGLSHA